MLLTYLRLHPVSRNDLPKIPSKKNKQTHPIHPIPLIQQHLGLKSPIFPRPNLITHKQTSPNTKNPILNPITILQLLDRCINITYQRSNICLSVILTICCRLKIVWRFIRDIVSVWLGWGHYGDAKNVLRRSC
jgi:hypothetical protein